MLGLLLHGLLLFGEGDQADLPFPWCPREVPSGDLDATFVHEGEVYFQERRVGSPTGEAEVQELLKAEIKRQKANLKAEYKRKRDESIVEVLLVDLW